MDDWEDKRKQYLERVVVDETTKDELMKQLYPKYICFIETNETQFEINYEFKGDSEEEARNLGIMFLKLLKEEINKIIEKC